MREVELFRVCPGSLERLHSDDGDKSYLDKLHTAGKTPTEALRLLRRRLSDAVFSALRTDEKALHNAALAEKELALAA